MKKLVLTFIALCVSSLALLNAQQKTQKELFQATYNNSKTLIKNQHYKFISETIYDDEIRQKSDGDNLDISKDKIIGKISSLPQYNTKLNFDSNYSDYKTTFDDDKQQIKIELKVRDIELFIQIQPNGKAFLTISNKNKIKITQVGYLE